MPDWPTSPLGVGSARQFHDAELNHLIEMVHDDNPGWFKIVTLPDEPPDVEDYPQFLQEDILADYRENKAATPDWPTDGYRREVIQYLETVQASRSRVQPESLTPLDEIPDGIIRTTREDWIFYQSTEELERREDDWPRSAAETTRCGKYLFFTTEETGVLEKIVFEQFQKRPFESAKVPSAPNRDGDAVLCLYYHDDRYKDDLRTTYQNEPVIMPRGFKPDKTTSS